MPDAFSDIMLRLQGEKVTTAPRVSRETIIGILREHTSMLGEIKKDLAEISTDMKMMTCDAQENKRSITDFREEIENALSDFKRDATQSAEDMKRVLKLNGSFQKQMDSMNAKLADFPVVRAEVKEQQSSVEALTESMLLQTGQLNEFMAKSTTTCDDIERQADNIALKMKELKVYVGTLADNLLLSSNQITVASSAGFATKPMVLFDVLKSCHDSISVLQTASASHTLSITANREAMFKKADDSIVIEVSAMALKMKEIDEIQRKEEDFGMTGLRYQCNSLTNKFDVLSSELHDKVGTRQMDSAVHRKYEDIVAYLKDSLAATDKDEKKFDGKIEEFRAAVQLSDSKEKTDTLSAQKLSNSKADRAEVTPIQEMLVKAQATLYKMGVREKERDALEATDTMSKQEVTYLLEQKVNRAEFAQQIESISRSIKKNRKLQALSAGISETVRDEVEEDPPVPKNAVFSSNSITLVPKPASGLDERRKTYTPGSSVPHSRSGSTADFAQHVRIERERGRKDSRVRGDVTVTPPEMIDLLDSSDINHPEAHGQQTQGQSHGHTHGQQAVTPQQVADRLRSKSLWGGNRPSTAVVRPEGVQQSMSRPLSPLKRPSSSVPSTHSVSAPQSVPRRSMAAPEGMRDFTGKERSSSPPAEGRLAALRPTDPNAPDGDLSDSMMKGLDGHFYFTDESCDTPGPRKQEYEAEGRTVRPTN